MPTPLDSKYWSALLSACSVATLFSLSHSAVAQETKLKSTSSLEQNFLAPPPSARPWVYWFVMDGNFTREGISADLEAMKRAGIGGAIFMEVNVGVPRGPVHFMSPQWQQLWKHAVKESERLGLQLTLNGGPGWTGSGGPWVKAEQSMQSVVSASQEVTGPQHFNGVLPRGQNRSSLSDYYKDSAVLAFPTPAGNARIPNIKEKSLYDWGSYVSQSTGKAFVPSYATYASLPAREVVDSRKVLDLTSKVGADGRLNWDVPAGRWTIIRFGATNNGASTLPAPAPGVGMESDKFSVSALDAHFNAFVGSLLKTVGPRKNSSNAGWNMLHIDSWEVGTQNWTPNFLAEFKRRRGYEATLFLPILNGLVVDSNEKSERFLWDWRQTCQELLVQNHVQHFGNLARQHGFGLSIEPYDKVMASDLSLGAPADVPMGEFWLYDSPPETVFSITEAASIGHTNGRHIVGAEAFTSGPSEAWQAYPGSMKQLGDWAFCAGINRFVIHRYQHQPDLDKYPGMTMGPFGVHWERTQTWWDLSPAYHRYLARSQYLLRQGLPVADICYLAAEGAPQVFRAPRSATKGSPPERLGYSFDGCAPEIVLNRMTVKNGWLTLPDGTSYRVLVLPERDTMTPQLLSKISRLVQDGATVIGPRPRTSPSLSGYPQSDAQVQRLAHALWHNCDGVKVTEHRFGKGRVIWKRDELEDISRERPSPFVGAQWIWFPEGNPAVAAPVGTRYFSHSVTLNVSQISSARITLTADNSFTFSVNGKRIGEGDNFREQFSFDITRALQDGNNTFLVAADNGERSPGDRTPNPAGFIANIRLKFRDGHVEEIPTDARWQSSSGANLKEAVPSLALGAFDAGPWNLPATVAGEQYGDFSVVASALESMKVPTDFASDGPIRYIHRRNANTELYFVANREEKTVETNCTFRVTGKAPELWNPLTGERRFLHQYREQGGRITVPLRFEPYQSWFVVFRPSKLQATGIRNFPALRSVGAIRSAWQVSFDPRRGGPAHTTFDKLDDWSVRPEPGIKYYSGKSIYRNTFAVPRLQKGAPLYLDLGVVKNLAQVRVNGRDVGTLWCAPWRVDISKAVKSGSNSNQLEITVANLWPNRLIGDQKLSEDQRLTSTTWNPYTAGSPLLSSGLLGPVRLLRESR